VARLLSATRVPSCREIQELRTMRRNPGNSGIHADHISVRLYWAWARLLAMGFGTLIEGFIGMYAVD
jgi:hypothetical protein